MLVIIDFVAVVNRAQLLLLEIVAYFKSIDKVYDNEGFFYLNRCVRPSFLH